MDKPKTGPKEFFLWVGAMIALYVSTFSFLALFFDYIDVAFPDALNSYIDPYSSSIRFEIASLVVLVPVFLVLMRLIRSDIAKDTTKKNLWVRRWGLVLTIFAAGVTVAVDLITLINTFLGGELTVHFVLKVLVVLLVMSLVLMHFLADLWGYWDSNPHLARRVSWGVGVLVVITILSGFFIIGAPGEVRLYRFDDQKITDLQNIQYQITSYWQTEGRLPMRLLDLNDSIQGITVPVDSQTGTPYQYATTSAVSFRLCAVFNADTQSNSPTMNSYALAIPTGTGSNNSASETWYHAAGKVCFARTIDPKRYPVAVPAAVSTKQR
jgi:hypothetical protein